MGACVSTVPESEKKLQFSPKELQTMSQHPAVRCFIQLTGPKKFGGLDYKQFLKIFDIPEGVHSLFTVHFAKVFMGGGDARRVLASTVGFEEFVYIYSVWARGSLDDRTALLFQAFDQHNKRYLAKTDIEYFLKSVFRAFFKNDAIRVKTNSAEQQARNILCELSDAELDLEANFYFAKLALEAIRNYSSDINGPEDEDYLLHHPEELENRRLFFDDFQRWVTSQKWLMDFLTTPDDLDGWMAKVNRDMTLEKTARKTLKLAEGVYATANSTLRATLQRKQEEQASLMGTAKSIQLQQQQAMSTQPAVINSTGPINAATRTQSNAAAPAISGATGYAPATPNHNQSHGRLPSHIQSTASRMHPSNSSGAIPAGHAFSSASGLMSPANARPAPPARPAQNNFPAGPPQHSRMESVIIHNNPPAVSNVLPNNVRNIGGGYGFAPGTPSSAGNQAGGFKEQMNSWMQNQQQQQQQYGQQQNQYGQQNQSDRNWALA